MTERLNFKSARRTRKTEDSVLIIWPERRSVSAETIRTWYSDAIANGDIDPEGMPRLRDTSIETMTAALNDAGIITASRS